MDANEVMTEIAANGGVTIGSGGVVIAIGGVKHRLKDPKVRDLREIDTLFWKVGDDEQVTIDAAGDDDVERSRAQAKWRRDTGGFAEVWALILKLLADLAVPADELPAWAVDGNVILTLVNWWWKTPLALGATPRP